MARYDPRGERATRDIVSRAMFTEMRAGRTTPHGGLYIAMGHLGPDHVRREFKGMVERCADCGFDLAGGRVEVVPTAHYMMGGVEFEFDCTHRARGTLRRRRGHRRRAWREPSRRQWRRELHRVRRHRRRSVADWLAAHGELVDGRRARRSRAPQARARIRSANQPATSRRSASVSTNDVGRRRHHPRPHRARARARRARCAGRSSPAHRASPMATRMFNLTWHDWLNLDSLIGVSKAIAQAALAREDSRGAHYREDFPSSADPASLAFTRIRGAGEALATRVRAGRVSLAFGRGRRLLKEAGSDARRRHRCAGARPRGREESLHALGQPRDVDLRRGAGGGSRTRARPARGGERAHGRRLGAADGRGRRRARHRRSRSRERGRRRSIPRSHPNRRSSC